MLDTQVLIVGAGPTGLALGLCLVRHGIAFRIIEKNLGPGQASRATVVQARTLELYQQLGIADEVVARGIALENFHLREAGQDVVKLAFNAFGKGLSPFPFVLSFPQDDHERFLSDKLREAEVIIEWGVELKESTQDDRGVRVVLDKSGTSEICEVAYLCGCDGARSRVRQDLKLAFPGGGYSQLFYVADVAIDGDWVSDLFGNLGANSLALMFPVRSSGMRRLIGIVPADVAGRAVITFEDIRPEAEPLLGVRVTRVNWFSTYHVHHRVAARFGVGRCFIAGDAGHIHSPAGGQGMNTGIGDAVNLAWKLADVLRGRAPPSLLTTYETERISYARKLVATTDRAFRGVVGQGVGSRLLRTWLLPHLMPRLVSFSALPRWVFKTISQTGINYRESSLSAGKVGSVSGGDRLPWAATDGGDNFGALRSLTWQLHVYGRAAPSMIEAAAKLCLPVKAFPWSDAAGRAGLRQDAGYLVRPDGYVAFCSADQDARGLTAFAAERGLRFGDGVTPSA